MKKSIGKRIAQKVFHAFMGKSIPDHFVQSAPDPKNAAGLFQDGWASKLPFAEDASGASTLFADGRIEWFLSHVPDIENASILELGPLEGGHTFMLEKAGAKRVTAVEANGKAWLKCLAVKETMGLQRCHFLLGDFVKYLEQSSEQFDAAVACGILYHLIDPHRLFSLLKKSCKGPVFLWTMIWSEAIPQSHPRLAKNFSSHRKVQLPNGKEITLHRHEYGHSMLSSGFWGGNHGYSEWMSNADVVAAAEAAGYRIEAQAYDEPRHPNGPAMAYLLVPAS